MDQGNDQNERKVGVPEIAEAWGTSRAYVYKLAKAGCPLGSLEAASAWRSANAKLGVGYRSRGSKTQQPPSGGQGEVDDGENGRSYGKTVPRAVKVKTLEQSLKEAIRIEQMAAEAVHRSEGNPEKMVTAINAYNKAQANRMETEKRVLELKTEQKKLITVDQARAIINRAWMPLLARIRSAPKRAALKANPSNDALAEEVFRDEIEIAIAEGQSSYAVALG